MKISIAVRYRPFSHEAGASCLLPRTGLVIQAFPTLIRVGRFEVALPLHGPIKEFTLQQDLEKGCVFVFGIAKEGRFRIRIEAMADGIHWTAEKAPALIPAALWWNHEGAFLAHAPTMRFSLGCHRAQDMEQVWRRFDLQELLPLLYRLSQWTPAYPSPNLKLCELGFEELLRGAFRSILTPSWTDERHQGLLPTETALPDLPPAALVHELGLRIRKLLICDSEMSIVLANPHFPFGRCLDLSLSHVGSIDLEWSKHSLRKVILRTKASGKLRLQTPYRSFRLRASLREKGKVHSRDLIEVEENHIYYLDRFQK